MQFDDTQIINDHIVNETRFQYRRAQLFASHAGEHGAQLSVSRGFFTGGGNSEPVSNDHSDHLELQNITTMSEGAQAIKFGTWLRDNRDANSTNANFNGSFSFPSLAAYVATLNGLAARRDLYADCRAPGRQLHAQQADLHHRPQAFRPTSSTPRSFSRTTGR